MAPRCAPSTSTASARLTPLCVFARPHAGRTPAQHAPTMDPWGQQQARGMRRRPRRGAGRAAAPSPCAGALALLLIDRGAHLCRAMAMAASRPMVSKATARPATAPRRRPRPHPPHPSLLLRTFLARSRSSRRRRHRRSRKRRPRHRRGPLKSPPVRRHATAAQSALVAPAGEGVDGGQGCCCGRQAMCLRLAPVLLCLMRLSDSPCSRGGAARSGLPGGAASTAGC